MYSDQEQILQHIPECGLTVFNFASPHQDTPLHLAVKECHVETVKCLLKMGANIHCKDGHGVSE